jgi:NADH-quinone oxidoreductase subunit H
LSSLDNIISYLSTTMVFGVSLAWLILGTVMSFAIMVGLLTGMAYTTYFERRIIALMQVRKGPNRVGPFGLFQPLADGVKAFFKEDTRPATADAALHSLAPGIAIFAALMAFVVVPIGPILDVPVFGKVAMSIADLNVGLLYLMGVSSLHVYGVVLGGWASNSKYSLLGALRGAAQLISYEVVLGMSLAGVVMITGEMSLRGIVQWQIEHGIPLVLLQPVGFLLFFVTMFAETNRAPFDLVEADTELVGGFQTEYSGFRFSMFMMAEYVGMITVSAVATTLFFGGWAGPIPIVTGLIGGPWWVFLGVLFFLFIFVWVRATIPRLRYDQLMKFSWNYLIPIGLVNLAVTAVLVVLLS